MQGSWWLANSGTRPHNHGCGVALRPSAGPWPPNKMGRGFPGGTADPDAQKPNINDRVDGEAVQHENETSGARTHEPQHTIYQQQVGPRLSGELSLTSLESKDDEENTASEGISGELSLTFPEECRASE